MNTRKLLPAAAMLLMMTACTQEEITPAVESVPVKLAYTTVEAAETRAATDLNQGTFTSGESVKVRISNTGAGSWTDYTFTTGDAGAMSAPDPAPCYPAGTNIDIVAYYPATAGASFTVAADQRADADYKASDLMFASVTNQAKQAEAVNLSFAHKMAKLCVNVSTGQGVTSINSVSILNVLPTVSFDQATGEVGSASGDAIRIAMSNNGAAVIPAQTIDGGLLSIVTDKGTATYSVSNKAFAAGRLYTLNITVNLRAVGMTTAITGWTSEGTVTVNPVANTAPVAIDMGNGLKWANMNVGAWSETDYGDHFCWGVTMPFYVEHDAYGNAITGQWLGGKDKYGYDWRNYPLSNETGSILNKYCTDEYCGTVDNKTQLELVDDAARANWGGGWRMPTDDDWTWLRNNCTWTWTVNYNGTGVNGMLVRSKIEDYTDNTIFLPAAGYFVGKGVGNKGSKGDYWSSSVEEDTPNYAMEVHFKSDGISRSGSARFYGMSIRPVKE